MRCCFDASEYTGVPDCEPCARTIDVPAAIRALDALYAASRESEAQSFLERKRAEAAEIGDWRGELSMLSELLGQYRRSMPKRGLPPCPTRLRSSRRTAWGARFRARRCF